MNITSADIEDVLWSVTYRCNLSCIYCSVEAGKGYSPFPDPESWQIDRILDQITSLPKLKSLILSGGEFLMSPQYPAVLKKIAARNIDLFVITNGTYISEEILSNLHQSIATVMVSIDSSNPAINAITRGYKQVDTVMQNIERYKQAGLQVVIIMVVTRHNISTIIDDLKTFHKNGFKNVLLQQLHAEGRGSLLYHGLSPAPLETVQLYQNLKQLELDFPDINLDYNEICLFPMRPDYFKKRCEPGGKYKPQKIFMCGAGYKFLAVKSNGDVIPCNVMQDYVFGSLLEQDINTILEKSEKLSAMQSWRNHRVNEIAGCDACPHNPICDGGCRADVLNLGLGLLAKHPYCCFNYA